MEEIKTVIKVFEQIRKSNSKIFESCQEEKIAMDTEYGALYQAFWKSDLRLGDAIDLLKTTEKYVTYKEMPEIEGVIRHACNKK